MTIEVEECSSFALIASRPARIDPACFLEYLIQV